MTMIKDFLLAQFALLEQAPKAIFEKVISQKKYEKYIRDTREEVPSASLLTELKNLTYDDFSDDSVFAHTSRDFFVKELALLLSGKHSRRSLFFLATTGTIPRSSRDLLIFSYLTDGYKKNLITKVVRQMLLYLEQEFHLNDTIMYISIVTVSTRDLQEIARLHAFLQEILDAHILHLPLTEKNKEFAALHMEEIQKLADQIKIDRKKAI